MYHLLDRHTVAQDARDELGIVPVFGIELAVQTFDGYLEAFLVAELEVVVSFAVFVPVLDYLAVGNALRHHDTFVVIGYTGEDLVRTSILETNESDPLLAIVLEANDLCFQFARTGDKHALYRGLESCRLLFLVFLLRLVSDKDATARTVAIDSTAFAAAFPCFHIQGIDQLFGDIGGEVDGYADGVVYPLLDAS